MQTSEVCVYKDVSSPANKPEFVFVFLIDLLDLIFDEYFICCGYSF